jgi:hypothetical protein
MQYPKQQRMDIPIYQAKRQIELYAGEDTMERMSSTYI